MGLFDFLKKQGGLSPEKREELLNKIEQWHENDEPEEIINTLEKLPQQQLDYTLTSYLARAYNNKTANSREETHQNLSHALQLLESVKEEGQNDPLWHYRMGYSLQELEREPEAVLHFEQAIQLAQNAEESQYILEDAQGRLEYCREIADFLDQPMEQEQAYYETESYMIIIPQKEMDDDLTLNFIPDRIKEIEGVEIMPIGEDEENKPTIRIRYNDEVFNINYLFYPVHLNNTASKIRHQFSDEEFERMQQTQIGICVAMEFGSNYMDSYHLQLKIVDAIMPDALAVIDESAEQLLSGRWVHLAAVSSVPPPSAMMFVVQAVSDEQTGNVWMHTHGLARCKVPELELLGIDIDNYQAFGGILNSTARVILNENKHVEPYSSIYVGALNEDTPLNVTLVPWTDAISDMPAEALGGKVSRKYNHNSHSAAIYYYPSEQAEERKEVHPLKQLEGQFGDNEIYFFSARESDHMHLRALERIDYMVKAARENPENAIVKLGIRTDDSTDEDPQKEHIWFEIVAMTGDRTFMAKCLNQPYWVSTLKQGDINTYGVEQITDWVIRIGENTYTPDDAYLL